jgi:hypothetical protein
MFTHLIYYLEQQRYCTNIEVHSEFCSQAIRNTEYVYSIPLSKGCHLDVVRGPSTPHDPESDAGGSLSSWQCHPSR